MTIVYFGGDGPEGPVSDEMLVVLLEDGLRKLAKRNPGASWVLPQPVWEYWLIPQQEVSNIRSRTVAQFLDGQGQFGWELCGIDYGSFIMKRRKA